MNDKIILVDNGVFPIIKDINNNKISNDTGWDFGATFQGEGKWSGVPCFFIRFSTCNLRCGFLNSICDTAYSSFHPERNIMDIDDILNIIKINNVHNKIKHIVISGGEPCLQTEPLINLCKKLKESNYIITIETNATIYHNDFSRYVDMISMSPKLKSSIPTTEILLKQNLNIKWQDKHNKSRKNLFVIQSFINGAKENKKEFQLKFVISNEHDIFEIENEWLNNLTGWEKEDILLMPEGLSEKQLKVNNKSVSMLSVKYGYRFCPRLHIDIFGGAKKGV